MTTAPPIATPPRFGDALGSRLDDLELSVRQASRRLAGLDPAGRVPEHWRRSLNRWLHSGHVPREANLRLLERALELEAGHLDDGAGR